MSKADLTRIPQATNPQPCIGCQRKVSAVVSFRDGERLCERCARRVVAIFEANADRVKSHGRALRQVYGEPEVKGGRLTAKLHTNR